MLQNCSVFLKYIFEYVSRNSNSPYSEPNISMIFVSNLQHLDMMGVVIHDSDKIVQFCKYMHIDKKGSADKKENFHCSAISISKRYLKYIDLNTGEIYGTLYELISGREELFENTCQLYDEISTEVDFNEFNNEIPENIKIYYRNKVILNDAKFVHYFPMFSDDDADFRDLILNNMDFFARKLKFYRVTYELTDIMSKNTFVMIGDIQIYDIHDFMANVIDYWYAYYIEDQNYSNVHTFRFFKEIENIENVEDIAQFLSTIEKKDYDMEKNYIRDIADSVNDDFKAKINQIALRSETGHQEIFENLANVIIKNIFRLIF